MLADPATEGLEGFPFHSPGLGHIRGAVIRERQPSISSSQGKVLCHYFGGVPYALPPTGPHRWKRPRPLPVDHVYGTAANPAVFTGMTGICPQQAPDEQPDPSLVTEDCLQLNVWMPAGDPPQGGWPIYFYIHGGSLQFGNANNAYYAALLGKTDFNAIIVCPAYRLNVFGFLAGAELVWEAEADGEPAGNFGFWDQRLALEWTHNHAADFGGNPRNITVAGYSAGAHSVFHQLSYDIGLPDEQALISRAIMHSNSPITQPKTVDEWQHQFNELVNELKIHLDLSNTEKLKRLRETNAADLVAANMRMNMHEIRSVTDGVFVRKTLFQELKDGSYARRMKQRGIKLWIGECSDEHFLYRTLRPPKEDSCEALMARFHAEYPQETAEALIALYLPQECATSQIPSRWASWVPDGFGRIWGDVQVHMLQRGFVECLVRGGASDLIYRYRIEWRAQETDAKFPLAWGVTHSSDNSIWMFGEGRGLLEEESRLARVAFVDLYAKFVRGEDITADWGAKAPRQMRRMKASGEIDMWNDELWEQGLEVWRAVNGGRLSSQDLHLVHYRLFPDCI